MQPTIGAPVVDIVSTIHTPRTIQPSVSDNGAVSFSFDAPPGLYQLSVVMDAAEFDFEQLYEILNKHGNVNRRTGPWDFSINFNNSPLVPSYWVSVNGERRSWLTVATNSDLSASSSLKCVMSRKMHTLPTGCSSTSTGETLA